MAGIELLRSGKVNNDVVEDISKEIDIISHNFSVQNIKNPKWLDEVESFLFDVCGGMDKFGGKAFSSCRNFIDNIISILMKNSSMRDKIDTRKYTTLCYERILHIFLKLSDSTVSLTQFQDVVTEKNLINLFQCLSERISKEVSYSLQESALGILARIYFCFQKKKDDRIRSIHRILPFPVFNAFKDDKMLRDTLKSPRDLLNTINKSNPNIESFQNIHFAIESENNEVKRIKDGWTDIGTDEMSISSIGEARISVLLEEIESFVEIDHKTIQVSIQ